MRHILQGTLIHIFEKNQKTDNGSVQRFALQVLYTPEKGVVNEEATLHSPYLPKGVNPNFYMERLGHKVTIDMKQWETNDGHGFYIADVNHIRFEDNKGQK